MSKQTDILKISFFGYTGGNANQLLAFDVMQEQDHLEQNASLLQDTLEKLIIGYYNAEFSYDIESINEIGNAADFIKAIISGAGDSAKSAWGVHKTLTVNAQNPLKYGRRILFCYISINKTTLLGS